MIEWLLLATVLYSAGLAVLLWPDKPKSPRRRAEPQFDDPSNWTHADPLCPPPQLSGADDAAVLERMQQVQSIANYYAQFGALPSRVFDYRTFLAMTNATPRMAQLTAEVRAATSLPSTPPGKP